MGDEPTTRRRLLRLGRTLLSAGLAGCSGSDDGTGTDDDGGADTDDAAADDGGPEDSSRTDESGARGSWPMYQQNAANNAFLPDANGPNDAGLAWSIETERGTLYGPALQDGTLYAASTQNLYAVDATNGTVEWTANPGEYELEWTPAVAEGRVLLVTDDGVLFALDADSGDTEWSFGPDGPRDGVAPTVVDDTVYLALEEVLAALSLTDGTERWRRSLPEDVLSAPAVADGSVYLWDGATLRSLAAVSGETEWAVETTRAGNTGGASAMTFESAPTVADGTVYIGTDVLQERTDDGKIATYPGVVVAVDADSGEQRWRSRTDSYEDQQGNEVGYAVTFSPTVADGTVYAGTDRGVLYALEEGSVEWTYEGPTDAAVGDTPLYSSPTVADGTVFMTANGVYALDAATGEQRWSLETESYVRGSPTAADGRLYVGTAGESEAGSILAVE